MRKWSDQGLNIPDPQRCSEINQSIVVFLAAEILVLIYLLPVQLNIFNFFVVFELLEQ
jgi:hypothetical protein